MTIITDDNQVITFYPKFDEIEWTTFGGRVLLMSFEAFDKSLRDEKKRRDNDPKAIHARRNLR